jgi:hypothetical protein
MGHHLERRFGKKNLRWRSIPKDARRSRLNVGSQDLGPKKSDRACSQIYGCCRYRRYPIVPRHPVLSPDSTTGRRPWLIMFQASSNLFA